jgi:hypothetical protein
LLLSESYSCPPFHNGIFSFLKAASYLLPKFTFCLCFCILLLINFATTALQGQSHDSYDLWFFMFILHLSVGRYFTLWYVFANNFIIGEISELLGGASHTAESKKFFR